MENILKNLINEDESKIYQTILQIENLKNIYNSKFVHTGSNCHVTGFLLPPSSCSKENIGDFFKDKAVLYLAFTKDNVSYIGESCDFGERIQTHLKNCRYKNNPLYKSARYYGKIYFIPIYYRDFKDFNGDKALADEWVKKMEKITCKKLSSINGKLFNKIV